MDLKVAVDGRAHDDAMIGLLSSVCTIRNRRRARADRRHAACGPAAIIVWRMNPSARTAAAG